MFAYNTDYYYISNRVFYKLNLTGIKKGKKTISKNGKENYSQDLFKFKVVKNDQDKQFLSYIHVYQNNINDIFNSLEEAKNSQIKKLKKEIERIENIQQF